QAAPPRGGGARVVSVRLAILAIVLTAAAVLAGCSPVLETDQARLCRMALPALMAQDVMAQEAPNGILAHTPGADERGLSVDFTVETPGGGAPQYHFAACRFRM